MSICIIWPCLSYVQGPYVMLVEEVAEGGDLYHVLKVRGGTAEGTRQRHDVVVRGRKYGIGRLTEFWVRGVGFILFSQLVT